MRTSMFSFATDFDDEDVDVALRAHRRPRGRRRHDRRVRLPPWPGHLPSQPCPPGPLPRRGHRLLPAGPGALRRHSGREPARKGLGRCLERLFATSAAYDPAEATREHVDERWDGELDAYLRAREAVIADAPGAVAEELEGTGTRLAFMDQAGAMKGYADGEPTGGPAPEVSWQIGVDPAQLAAACDEFQVLAYAKDPARVSEDLDAYRALLGDAYDVRAALRPIPPDCTDPDNLRAKLAVARSAGAVAADLYHYGFARLETLDLVHVAQEEAAGTDGGR